MVNRLVKLRARTEAVRHFESLQVANREFRTMARKGTGFFDTKGHYFKTPEEATLSDLAAMLGKIGDGESLAPGIAHTMLDRRSEIERLFAEHDAMMADYQPLGASTVTRLPPRAG
jgi:hypothetical protein